MMSLISLVEFKMEYAYQGKNIQKVLRNARLRTVKFKDVALGATPSMRMDETAQSQTMRKTAVNGGWKR